MLFFRNYPVSFKLIIAVGLMAASATLIAETRYVSDQLRITVRSGTSTGHAVITTIDSGEAVEVLQRDEATGYTQVRLKNGKQGWALSRYLLPSPIARDQLKSVQSRLSDVQQKLAQLEPVAEQQSQEIEALTSERDQLAESLEQLKIMTADSVALIEKDKALQEEVATLTSSNEALRHRVDQLSDDHRLRWFMYGGGVMGIGVLFGLILPKLRIQRKSWNEF